MRRAAKREQIGFELTPLIDVVFLLLIFFLVTSTFKKDELALLLKLPKNSDGKAATAKELKKVIIELKPESMAINGKTSSIEGLEAEIKTLTDKNIPFILRADQKVEYSRLVDVLGLLQKYEIGNLSLVTEGK